MELIQATARKVNWLEHAQRNSNSIIIQMQRNMI